MADCPQDDEIDRPQNMMEMVSGDESWKEVGLRVKWTDPPLPSKRNLVAGEPILVYMAIEAKKDVSDSEHDIGAFCWTNTSFVENRCTTWKDIKMFENTNCRDEETPGIVTHIYQGSLAPSLENVYRLTFNVKWKQFMIWAGQYQVDSIIYVSQSSGKNINIQVPVNFPTRYPFSQEDVRCETVPDPLQFKPDGDYTRARAPSKALSKTRASSRSLVTPEGRRSSTKPKASANEFRDVELMRGAAAAEEAEIQEGQPAEDEVDVQAVTRQSESGAGVEYEVLTQEETGDQEPAEVEEKVAAGEEEEEEEKVAAEEWEEEMDADEELKKKLANEEDVELLVML